MNGIRKKDKIIEFLSVGNIFWIFLKGLLVYFSIR
jgi:hypothetical protein